VPRIEVSFDIDADGILNAVAKDTASSRSQSIRITGSTRLPEAEKRRMVEQAERYAEDDRKRREAAEQLNDADAVCYQAERTLADYGSKIAGDLRKRIETALRDTRTALAAKDATSAKDKAGALKGVLQEVGQALYATVQSGPGSPAEQTTGEARPTGSSRVVDAEYKQTTP
jgi:molecular chaperone DnaK